MHTGKFLSWIAAMQKIDRTSQLYAATVTRTCKEFVMLAALWAEGGDYDGPFRDMVHIDREVSVLEASRVMRCRRVDVLLVTDPGEGAVVPLGVVTARDIVSRVLATGLDAAVVTVGDIAWSDEGNTFGGALARIAGQT
jgi:hypothetical protein